MRRFATCVILLCFCALLRASHPLAGKWLGAIDTERGQMQIGLELTESGRKLTGAVNTAHGDWPVKSVTEHGGTFVVTFDSGEGTGTMSGQVKDGRFAGQWDNGPMGKGTFELKKAMPKKRE